MKINYNKWGRNYALLPCLSIIINDNDFGIHFVIWNHHFYTTFNRK